MDSFLAAGDPSGQKRDREAHFPLRHFFKASVDTQKFERDPWVSSHLKTTRGGGHCDTQSGKITIKGKNSGRSAERGARREGPGWGSRQPPSEATAPGDGAPGGLGTGGGGRPRWVSASLARPEALFSQPPRPSWLSRLGCPVTRSGASLVRGFGA